MRLDDLPFLGEIKEEYKEIRAKGKNRNDSVQELMNNYADELAFQDEDSWLFWVALADAQLACKELSLEIAERAASALDALAKTEYACAFTKTRIEKLKNSYAQAPMPEQAKIRVRKKFQCQWKLGDTFAYQLKGEAAESLHIDGKYILLRKVDESEYKGEVQPVVTLTYWGDKPLPSSQEEFLSVPPLKLSAGRMNSPVGSYEYRCQILFTSKKAVTDLNLQYIGNFPDIKMLADEFIPDEVWTYLLAAPQRLALRCCIALRGQGGQGDGPAVP